MKKLILVLVLTILFAVSCDDGNNSSKTISERVCNKVQECSLLGEFGYNNYDQCVAYQNLQLAENFECLEEFTAIKECQITLNCNKFEEDDGETHCPSEYRVFNKCVEDDTYGDSVCTEGVKTCNGTTIQICRDSMWINETDCSTSGETCENGACKASQTTACTYGASVCEDNSYKVCMYTAGSTEETTWVSVDCSASGKICDASQGCVNENICTEGTKTCNGTTIRVCQNNVWVSSTNCSTISQICENGACIREETGTVCDGIDCSGHGSCEIVENSPECQCNDGYIWSGSNREVCVCYNDDADVIAQNGWSSYFGINISTQIISATSQVSNLTKPSKILGKLKNNTDISFSTPGSYAFETTLSSTTGTTAPVVVLITFSDPVDNTYTIATQSIIVRKNLQVINNSLGGSADFAPKTFVIKIWHDYTTSDKKPAFKQCTVAASVLANNTTAGGDMPVGTTKICADSGTMFVAGNTLNILATAQLTDNTDADLCTCSETDGGDHNGDGDTEDSIDCTTGKVIEDCDSDGNNCVEVTPDAIVADCTDTECTVPAGSFWMGCNATIDDECYSDEYPYHEVTLSEYTIDKYEVTVSEYQKCVDAGDCNNKDSSEPHYYTATDESDCNLGAEGKSNHPMNCVTWYGAKAYCEWVGKRLPTEAEWEKAARGTDGRIYPWGNETATCDYVVMYDSDSGGYGCGTGGTWEIASKPKGISPYGVYDMVGNVWEWTNDLYGEDYYSSSPSENPTGPKSGSLLVLRGGSWLSKYSDSSDYLRVSIRYRRTPDNSGNNGGFRCAE